MQSLIICDQRIQYNIDNEIVFINIIFFCRVRKVKREVILSYVLRLFYNLITLDCEHKRILKNPFTTDIHIRVLL